MGTERDQTNFEQIDNDTTANGKTGNGWSAEAAALPRTAVLIDRRASRVEPVERILKQLQVTVVGKTGSRNHALQLVSERNSKVLIEVEEATPEHDSISWLRTAQERVPQLTAIAISTTDGSARVVARPERTGHPEVVADTKRLDEVLADRIAGMKKANRTTHPTISVVIPTLNEADNLPLLFPRLPPDLHEVLLVDGASDDGTVEVARQLYPRIRTMTQAGSGKGEALRMGFEAATGDIIVMLDADGSTDPSEIPAFVGALCSGADFAKGSRFLQGAGTEDMPLHRRLGNGVFVFLVRLLFGGRYSDLCYGYNAFWKDILPVLQLDSDGFEIETAMNIRALRARLRVVEVASFEYNRLHGAAKLRTVADGWRVLKTIFKERLPRFQTKGDWPAADREFLG